MGLFKRKSKSEMPATCPKCSQIVEADVIDCPMCGHDLRETYAEATGAQRPSGAETETAP